MFSINWKYIVILAILAGMIYLLANLFMIGSVEAVDGNPGGYLLLIGTWIGVTVTARAFKEKIKVKDLTRILLFGMIVHIYFCFFYFLSEISMWLALISLPVLIVPLYGLYNKEGLMNALRILLFYTPFDISDHPHAYDAECKAYVFKKWNAWEGLKFLLLILLTILYTCFFYYLWLICWWMAFFTLPLLIIPLYVLNGKEWNDWEALKYLELKEGSDPVELLTIFYKTLIDIALEFHYVDNKLRIFCGIMASGRMYEEAMENCKKKFHEIYNYLRVFGYSPTEVWDDFTMEQILEAPYLNWDPTTHSTIRKNPVLDDEHVMVGSGLKRTKHSLFQLTSNAYLMGKRPSTKLTIQRSKDKNVKTEVLEISKDSSGFSTFLNRIMGQDGDLGSFIFIIKLHPLDGLELNKRKNQIKNNLRTIINNFKTDLQNNEGNFRMLQLSNTFSGQSEGFRRTGVLNMLYPDESKDLERLWTQLENYQLGEEIGYWKLCTYFVGKKYLANTLAAYLKSQLTPFHVANFKHVLQRRLFGIVENLDSKGVVNYLPFQETQ